MKLRFLRTKKERTYVVDYGWLNFLSFLEGKEFTRSYYETNLQVFENDKWVDVPIIDVDETLK